MKRTDFLLHAADALQRGDIDADTYDALMKHIYDFCNDGEVEQI